MVMWVCFPFVCSEFFVPFENFHSFADVTIAGERLQFLTYARHSWPLSSEGSLACHTYCDTGHLFIMVISEDPWHSNLMRSVWQWSCHYLFNDLSLSRLGFEHQLEPSAYGANVYPTAPPLRWRGIFERSE